jgi:hypothetical protein
VEDDKWTKWYERKRVRLLLHCLPAARADTLLLFQPMYALGHDGGLQSGTDELEAARILIQRQNLYDTVHQSLPYVLLQAAEFTDTKVRLCPSTRVP